VIGSTILGSLVTDGWYARYVLLQLPSQSWALRWIWDFWLHDLVIPFAVTLVVVGALVLSLPRAGRARWWPPRVDDQPAYLLAGAAGMLLASWVARLHEGGYANVAMPAQAAAAGAAGLLLAAWLRSERSTSPATGVIGALLAVQVVLMTSSNPDVVPSDADRAAGDRFVATLRDLPGAVLVPTHPYYLRLAGRPTHASTIAIDDLLHSSGGTEQLAGVVPWDLDGVSAVVLDNATDTRLFGPALTRDFTLVTSTVVPDGVFLPETDLATHPAQLYVRTSALAGR
jgi:hypothetical protein